MTSSVFMLGTEAWVNILLETISRRDRGCLSISPLLSSPLSLNQAPMPFAELIVRNCRKIAFLSSVLIKIYKLARELIGCITVMP